MTDLRKRKAAAAGMGVVGEHTKRRRSWADRVSEKALANGIETDAHRISQREKQISYGKNTLAYDTFLQAVPREKRMREHPCTPEVKQKCSKRSFDGQVKKWRRMLYTFKEGHDQKTAGGKRSERDAGVEGRRGQVKGEAAVCEMVAEGTDMPAAQVPKATESCCDSVDGELSEWEEEDWADEIQLDDEGNPILVSPATTAITLGTNTDTDVDKSQEGEPSPPAVKSIFDKF